MTPQPGTDFYFEMSTMSQPGVGPLLYVPLLLWETGGKQSVCVFTFFLQQLCKHTRPAGSCMRRAHVTQPGPDVRR